MSNVYSSFCLNSDLIVNGSTAPIGELTTKTIGYAKDPDFYKVANQPCSLVTFRGVSDTSNYEKIPTDHAQAVIGMLNWLYAQAKDGKTTNSSAGCLQLLSTQYSVGWEWISASIMVTNNQIWMPSSINFKLTVANVEHEFKIWFANEYLEVEFPYRDIYVIHPIGIAGIDVLAEMNYQQLNIRLKEETQAKVEKRVHETLGSSKYPYTHREVKSFDIYDLINTPFFNAGDWTIIYYGNPNDAEEETYEAIRQCILKNSKYGEDKWADVIPDLFNPSEFAAVPYWNEFSLRNETAAGSVLSPVYTHKTGTDLPEVYGKLWTTGTAIESLQIVPILYKSAKIAFIGKPKNSQGKTKFTDFFKDYQLIPSDDSQAGQMSQVTSDFVLDLENMIAAAEIVTPNGIPPAGIQRITKNGKLYISKQSGKIKITMISRYQFVLDGLLDE